MADQVPTDGTVAERIRVIRRDLTPAEQRVVAALVDNYPTAGLQPVAQLSAVAEVSGPTVLRLVKRLGFAGYGAFQSSLRDEVQSRLFSPVNVYPADAPPSDDAAPLRTAERLYAEGLRSTIRSIGEHDVAEAVKALTGAEQVVVNGGRYSTILAAHLGQYLAMLRAGVTYVQPTSAAQLTTLMDIDERTVVVVFDYRRYQQASVKWGVDAVERGAHLITITDAYLSPLASYSDTILATSHAGPGPFDSLAHGFMLAEILVALCALELGEPARQRLADFEDLQVREESAAAIVKPDGR